MRDRDVERAAKVRGVRYRNLEIAQAQPLRHVAELQVEALRCCELDHNRPDLTARHPYTASGIGMGIDMCIGMCIDMCIDMCIHMCIDIRHVCRHVYGHG